jgi:hypothetical protein
VGKKWITWSLLGLVGLFVAPEKAGAQSDATGYALPGPIPDANGNFPNAGFVYFRRTASEPSEKPTEIPGFPGLPLLCPESPCCSAVTLCMEVPFLLDLDASWDDDCYEGPPNGLLPLVARLRGRALASSIRCGMTREEVGAMLGAPQTTAYAPRSKAVIAHYPDWGIKVAYGRRDGQVTGARLLPLEDVVVRVKAATLSGLPRVSSSSK